jgi:hypothetical protein
MDLDVQGEDLVDYEGTDDKQTPVQEPINPNAPIPPIEPVTPVTPTVGMNEPVTNPTPRTTYPGTRTFQPGNASLRPDAATGLAAEVLNRLMSRLNNLEKRDEERRNRRRELSEVPSVRFTPETERPSRHRLQSADPDSDSDDLMDLDPAPGRPRKTTAKPEKPQEFTGKNPDLLDIFVTQAEMYLALREHAFADNHARVIWAASNFKDLAATWWTTQWRTKPRPDWMFDWDKFVDKLYHVYGQTNRVDNALHEITQSSQTGSVSDYYTRFLELVPDTDLGKQSQCYLFRKGLKPHLARTINLQSDIPTRLGQLAKMAQRLEQQDKRNDTNSHRGSSTRKYDDRYSNSRVVSDRRPNPYTGTNKRTYRVEQRSYPPRARGSTG